MWNTFWWMESFHFCTQIILMTFFVLIVYFTYYYHVIWDWSTLILQIDAKYIINISWLNLTFIRRFTSLLWTKLVLLILKCLLKKKKHNIFDRNEQETCSFFWQTQNLMGGHMKPSSRQNMAGLVLDTCVVVYSKDTKQMLITCLVFLATYEKTMLWPWMNPGLPLGKPEFYHWSTNAWRFACFVG